MQVIQESVIEKAKKFVVNNKGKLAALAGLAALGGAAYYGKTHGWFDNILNHEQEPGNNTGKTSEAGADNKQPAPKEGSNSQTNGGGSKVVSPLFVQNTDTNTTAHVKLPEHEIPGLNSKPVTVTTVDGRTITIPGKLDNMLNQVNMTAKEYFKQFNNNH